MVRLRDHPHIANIHDIGGDGASTYIVQEFMEGGSIADALSAAPENRLSIPEVIKISSQICQALAFAHSQGIVHRDVKPENVWLTADGTAKLGDFGLSIALDSSRLTQAGIRRELLSQACLADARLPCQQHDLPFAGDRARKRRTQLLRLFFSAHEHAAREALDWVRVHMIDTVAASRVDAAGYGIELLADDLRALRSAFWALL